MPTYEYACKSCGEHLEVVQSFSDDSLATCPACGGPLRKVFGSIGIAFKGTGFYKTDSRSAADAKGAKGAKKDAAASSSSSSSSSPDGAGSSPSKSSSSPKSPSPSKSPDSGTRAAASS